MKNKKRWSLLLMCICISFSLAGCAGNPSENPSEGETLDVEAGDTSVQESDVPANNTEDEDETMSEDSSDISENMRAVITINGAEYGMTITDTTIGRAFAKKLQDEGAYTVTGYRSTDDICCSESESLETDPAENMPWVCGGVAWTGSWFTIWVSEEAADREMPIVAQIDEEYSEELQALSGDMEIEVRLAAE